MQPETSTNTTARSILLYPPGKHNQLRKKIQIVRSDRLTKYLVQLRFSTWAQSRQLLAWMQAEIKRRPLLHEKKPEPIVKKQKKKFSVSLKSCPPPS